MGIIDILQEYNIKKKLESSFKSVMYAHQKISSVDPTQYAERFQKYIEGKIR
eukprot:TRINITY_DN9133_c0_g1_i1.p2 TRINITY_DN9133_c0_g1~~TRINITY_DN9133_c0_g1_i1.p2  ORF type:complete len:52 (-),score=7.15 TRINITY_DN9133_c0_g1_i1:76-231(-)